MKKFLLGTCRIKKVSNDKRFSLKITIQPGTVMVLGVLVIAIVWLVRRFA